MRLVIQRVQEAQVVVDQQTVGSIGLGFMILAGITHADTEKEVAALARKTAKLRIFSDEQGKTNLSLLDVGGEALVVSQFTLYADTRKGNRPSFGQAADPVEASRLIDYFILQLKECGVNKVASGVFGAHMDVSLCNSGPFTVILEN